MRKLAMAVLPLIGMFSMGNMDSCQGSNSSLNVNIEDGCFKAYSLCLGEVKDSGAAGTKDKKCDPRKDANGVSILDATGKPVLDCHQPEDGCRTDLNHCYDMYTAWSHGSFTNNSCQDDDKIAGNGCLVPEDVKAAPTPQK